MLKNRLPFDNALGSIEGAVDCNSTSPNFADPHNLFELRIRLLETEQTPDGSLPSEGGLYGPDPVFLGASLPADRLREVSSTVVEIGSDGEVITLVTPLLEAMDVQIEKAVVKLDRRPGWHRFEVEGHFELGPDGMIDVAGEDVEVRLFGLFEQTMRAGAFVRDRHNEGFEFETRSAGVFDMCIDDDGRFEIEIRRVDFTALGLDKPVILFLRIGNDVGEFSIQFDADGEFGVEKSGRSARSGKSDRSGRSARSGRSERSGKSDRSGKSGKSGKSRR